MIVVVHETRRKASKLSPQEGEDDDIISSMPDNVIANIMDRLSIKDAVGTSILSTSWRFKWTLLTQLIFNLKFFSMLARRKVHFDKSNITRLLRHLYGSITKFVIFITEDIELDDEDIHHWVTSLSRLGGFKELTLVNMHKTPVKLPTHLFPCLELKHLTLSHSVLSPSPYFRGFPNLLSLKLRYVKFQDHQFGELIAQCPLLETLKISTSKLRGEVKLIEIAKLKNLKVLGLSLCLLDNITMVRLSSVIQQMSLLPKLQELILSFKKCEFLAEDVAQNPVSATFPFLKTLALFDVDFSSVTMLSCAFGMLFGCVNLQTLHITVDSSTMGQLQLRNVKLESVKGLENEVCLIRYMLACSPMLECLVIPRNSSMNGNEKHKLARKLLKLHRASPVAEIIF